MTPIPILLKQRMRLLWQEIYAEIARFHDAMGEFSRPGYPSPCDAIKYSLRQEAVSPPSRVRMLPVIQEDSSEAR
jgi:hypothetical protein